MKKILFTLEIALFLLALPVVLGMALGRKLPVTNGSEITVPVVEKGSQTVIYSVAQFTAINKAI